MSAEILDACCGGRMWWWDKAHPLAVYMDNRVVPRGAETTIGSESRHGSGSWSCEPSLVEDFREMPFEDDAFQLVLFDPPHVIRDEIKGHVTLQYGALPKATAHDDLRRGFSECWRVLSPGGTLIFKWAGDPARVRPLFPSQPIVGTKVVRGGKGLGTRWFVFYKPLRGGCYIGAAQLPIERQREARRATLDSKLGRRGRGGTPYLSDPDLGGASPEGNDGVRGAAALGAGVPAIP